MAKLVHLILVVAILQYLSFDVNGASTTNTDCSLFKSCTDCAQRTGCTWCTAAYQCTNNVADVCRNDILVANTRTKGSGLGSYSEFCPKFTTVDNKNDILIPSGTRKSIQAKLQVVGHFLLQKRFICQFTYEPEGRVVTANAQLLGETFTCDAVEFTTQSSTSKVKFEILWDKTKALANPNNVQLTIFDCNKMANNCKSCFGQDAKFNCGWCKASSKCAIDSKCDKTSWVSRVQTCP